MRALWITLLAGCIIGEPSEPGDRPLTYTIEALWAPGAPSAGPVPVLYIDGEQAESRTFDYPSTLTARSAVHTLELRHGEYVVFSAVSALADGCLADIEIAASASESWCAFESGEVRMASYRADTIDGERCMRGDFCLPPCFPTGSECAAGQRCTSLYGSVDPLATRLGCAPIGPKAAGDTCSLVVAADGTYDDCGSGLLCVEGMCRLACSYGAPDLPAGCTTCSHVLGHAPEMGICD